MIEGISKEFRFLGFNAINSSIIFGAFLVTWGITVTQVSGSNSITSLIPTFVGLPVLILSFLTKLLPSKQKLLMHIVVLFGLVSVIGGADFFRSLISGSAFDNFWADLSKLIMFITGGLYCYVCIQHFRFIRAMKKNT